MCYWLCYNDIVYIPVDDIVELPYVKMMVYIIHICTCVVEPRYYYVCVLGFDNTENIPL